MIDGHDYTRFNSTSRSLRPFSAIDERKSSIRGLIDSGFPYSKKLSSHTSCVNAVAFSRSGRWLASAGDDPFVLLWDFHQEEIEKPTCGFVGHRANVFALAFSASDQFVYSGDTDHTIHKYDISRWGELADHSGSPVLTLQRHQDSIRAISCHPHYDQLFLSAGEDGLVILHDSRESGTHRAQGCVYGNSEVTSVQYHPMSTDLFITGDTRGEVSLRDTRMAFGGSVRVGQGIVQNYVTSLSKPSVSCLSKPEVGSITFDKTGKTFAVTFLHFFPTIYALSDPHPLATCSGVNLPDGTPVPEGARTYTNSCTIKHGSFGGPCLDRDEYYCAGSDDFRAYVWKIPEVAALKEMREVVTHDDWELRGTSDTIGFTSSPSSDRYIPVELSTPLCRLGGHKSIVNSTLMHPTMPYLVTAGVERHVILHSPVSNPPSAGSLARTPENVRALPKPNLEDRILFMESLMSDRRLGEEDDQDDKETIALFDEILRQEGTTDIFEARQWYPSSDEEDDADAL